MTATKPKVLFVYYTYSQQTLRVVEVMTSVLRERGCEVRQAKIEFTDPRYAERFSRFPLRHPYLDIFGMAPAQLRHATGKIGVPETVREGDYDLVCSASPTWWLNPCMPIRSFMESDFAGTVLAGKRFAAIVVCHRYWRNNLRTLKALGSKKGGAYLDGIWFIAAGGPIELDAGFVQLSQQGCDQRALPRAAHSSGEPPAELRRAGSSVRKHAGGSSWLR